MSREPETPPPVTAAPPSPPVPIWRSLENRLTDAVARFEVIAARPAQVEPATVEIYARLLLAVEEAACRLAQAQVPLPSAGHPTLLAVVEVQVALAARWAAHLRSRLGLPEAPARPAGGGA